MSRVACSPIAACGTPLQAQWLGRCEYAAVLARQEALLAAVAAGDAPQQILLLEHPPVYTLGRGADASDLRDGPERLGVPVFRIGRGGGATFHGPGQLVAYPIVRLRGSGRDVSGYVCALERALIDTCVAVGVAADALPGKIGVWVGERKVGSIGIGVRRGVSWHGIALNVSTDLSFFDAIVVCRGDAPRLVNLAELSADVPPLPALAALFARALATHLGMALEEPAWL